ncbi:MAG: DUF2628 domain-containing protein [Hyphomicrobiaceae bacterium]
MLLGWARGATAYTIHEARDHPVGRGERAEALVFVRDGFSLFAALLPPIWMVFNRLWLVLSGYLIITLGLSVAFALQGWPYVWLGYAVFGLNLVVGFEADSLIRWTLNRRDWRQIASVMGQTDQECERRFFESWLPTVPEISAAQLAVAGTPGGIQQASEPSSVSPSPAIADDLVLQKRKGWRSAIRGRNS